MSVTQKTTALNAEKFLCDYSQEELVRAVLTDSYTTPTHAMISCAELAFLFVDYHPGVPEEVKQGVWRLSRTFDMHKTLLLGEEADHE